MKNFRKLFSISLLVLSFLTLSSCDKLFNKSPEIKDQAFTIDENSPTGTVVGQIIADDKSGQELSFIIVDGDDDEIFSLEESTGILTVNNSSLLNYEIYESITITVQVKDEFGKWNNSEITINLTDIEPPTNGLMLYMPFDDNINDLSPNSNNGIDYTTGAFITGKYGQAKEFNGTSDYIELTNSYNNAFGFSCSFWVKSYGVNGVENNGVIIGKYSMNSNNRCFLINSFGAKTEASRADNCVFATFYDPSYVNSMDHDFVKSNLAASELSVYPDPSLWTIVSPQALTLNTWTHCIVNLTSTYLEIYINGSLCVKKRREHESYSDGSQVPTLIGNCLNGGDGTNNHFHGALDELRMYNRSFTADEIKTLFLE